MSRFVLPLESAFGSLGAALPGAKLYFYATGTATPQATYSNAALSTPNSNPVVANSAGRFGDIFLTPAQAYKVVLATSAGVTVWTADPVYPPLTTGSVAGLDGLIKAVHLSNSTSDQAAIAAKIGAVTVITADTTLSVPATYADINAALDYLNGKAISPDAIVTISVAAGTHTFTDTTISINHPDGDRIYIIGAGRDVCTLKITGTAGFWEANSFITLEGGERLGYLNGFTLDGNTQLGRTGGYPAGAGNAANAQGILLRRDCYMKLGADMRVKDFARCGILAYQGCTMLIEGDASNYAIIQNNGSDGLVSSAGSNIYARYVKSEGNWGYGFYADQNAFLDARNAQAINGVGTASGGVLRGGGGMIALFGSTIYANTATVTGNASTGIQANTDSLIIADGATVTGNGTNATATTRNGVYVVYGSTAYLDDVVATGNYECGIRVANNSTAYGARATCSSNNVSATAALAGLLVEAGSTYVGGSIVASSNTKTGVRIDTGSTATINGATASSNTEYGILITGGSTGYFDDAVVLSNSSSGVYIDLGSEGVSARLETRLNGAGVASQAGLYVINSSSFSGGGITASSNTGNGVTVNKASRATLTSATISSNTAQGLSPTNSRVAVTSSTIQSNGTYGIFASNGAYVDATSATISLNTTAQTSPALDTFGTRNSYIQSGTASALIVGGGTAITKILTASASLNFASIASLASADLTITVTGAAVNNPVILGLPAAPTAGIAFNGFVSAADTVTVRAHNYTAGAIDPANATYRVSVLVY